jgi:hypothetical protein
LGSAHSAEIKSKTSHLHTLGIIRAQPKSRAPLCDVIPPQSLGLGDGTEVVPELFVGEGDKVIQPLVIAFPLMRQRPHSSSSLLHRLKIATVEFFDPTGKLLGDVPTAGAILDRFLHHAQTIAITGRSYRLKDRATIAGKEDKNKKTKSKSNEPLTAEPAS